MLVFLWFVYSMLFIPSSSPLFLRQVSVFSLNQISIYPPLYLLTVIYNNNTNHSIRTTKVILCLCTIVSQRYLFSKGQILNLMCFHWIAIRSIVTFFWYSSELVRVNLAWLGGINSCTPSRDSLEQQGGGEKNTDQNYQNCAVKQSAYRRQKGGRVCFFWLTIATSHRLES